MLTLGLIELVLCLMCKPIIIDSLIYVVDTNNIEVRELRLKENIIDYAFDDFIYVLTNRYLYKIDYENLSFVDRTPLPQTFHGFSTNNRDIMLITVNEIIIVDKSNLTFKAGIGIEHGDYRPIISSGNVSISGENHFIYLIADNDKNSVIKIFNLNNGRLVKKISVDRIISFDYDTEDNTLTTLDSNDKLTIYDTHLNKNKVIHLAVGGQFFQKREDGYVIYNRRGLFLIANSGNVVDFQPMAMNGSTYEGEFLFLAEDGLLHIDTLTLRVKQFSQNIWNITRLFSIDCLNNYAIAIDHKNGFYFIDIRSLCVEPMTVKKIPFREIIHSRLKADSLWYFQLGAFTNYDNALTAYKQISQRGIPVFIDSTDLYRIKFGGFLDKTTAIEIIEKIDFNGWFMIQERIEKEGFVEFFAGSERYIFEDGIIRKE